MQIHFNVYIEEDITADELVERYLKGQRVFNEIAVFDNEKFDSIDLSGSKFENCFLSCISFNKVNLNGVVFNTCNLKCSDFLLTDLTNVTFENCAVDAISFKGCNTTGLKFSNNDYYGVVLQQKDLETFNQPE